MFNSARLFIEIGQSSVKLLDRDLGYEWPLERQENGRLSPAARQQFTANLKDLVGNRLFRPRAICAIGLRGVSLRRLSLPRTAREELDRLLALQIESEFPLAPDALCWGYSMAANGTSAANPAQQPVLVAALKKEGLEEYAEIFSNAGLQPVFTLAAWTRSFLCPESAAPFALLDIGRSSSELAWFEAGLLSGFRTLPWGGDHLTRAIQARLNASYSEAEKVKIHLSEQIITDRELSQKIEPAIRSEINALARALKPHPAFKKLYLSGKTARLKDLAPALASALDGLECQSIETLPGTGRSAAILGAKRSCELNGGLPPLIIEAKESRPPAKLARHAPAQRAVMACLIAGALLTLRYAAPVLNKSGVLEALARVRPYEALFPKVDAELDFLQFIKDNQPPYLDALYLLAKAATPGTRIDSLSMNRQGEISLRSTMREPQQIVEFRAKLIESGFFSSVVIDEQTPSPDRQKITFRMTAQWKPAGAREPVKIEAAPQAPNKPRAEPASPGQRPSRTGLKAPDLERRTRKAS